VASTAADRAAAPPDGGVPVAGALLVSARSPDVPG